MSLVCSCHWHPVPRVLISSKLRMCFWLSLYSIRQKNTKQLEESIALDKPSRFHLSEFLIQFIQLQENVFFYRPTFVHRFIVMNTIEENIFKAISNDHTGKWKTKEVTVTNLKELFILKS